MEFVDCDNVVESENTLCRLCAEKIDDRSSAVITERMRRQIHECFSIQIDPVDKLPKEICTKCKAIVNNFHATMTKFRLKQIYLSSLKKKETSRETINEDINVSNIIDLTELNSNVNIENPKTTMREDIGYDNKKISSLPKEKINGLSYMLTNEGNEHNYNALKTTNDTEYIEKSSNSEKSVDNYYISDRLSESHILVESNKISKENELTNAENVESQLTEIKIEDVNIDVSDGNPIEIYVDGLIKTENFSNDNTNLNPVIPEENNLIYKAPFPKISEITSTSNTTMVLKNQNNSNMMNDGDSEGKPKSWVIKYNCIFCSRQFKTIVAFDKHITSSHTKLKNAYRGTKHCFVSLKKFDQDRNQSLSPWIHLNKTMCHKNAPDIEYCFLSKVHVSDDLKKGIFSDSESDSNLPINCLFSNPVQKRKSKKNTFIPDASCNSSKTKNKYDDLVDTKEIYIITSKYYEEYIKKKKNFQTMFMERIKNNPIDIFWINNEANMNAPSFDKNSTFKDYIKPNGLRYSMIGYKPYVNNNSQLNQSNLQSKESDFPNKRMKLNDTPSNTDSFSKIASAAPMTSSSSNKHIKLDDISSNTNSLPKIVSAFSLNDNIHQSFKNKCPVGITTPTDQIITKPLIKCKPASFLMPPNSIVSTEPAVSTMPTVTTVPTVSTIPISIMPTAGTMSTVPTISTVSTEQTALPLKLPILIINPPIANNVQANNIHLINDTMGNSFNTMILQPNIVTQNNALENFVSSNSKNITQNSSLEISDFSNPKIIPLNDSLQNSCFPENTENYENVIGSFSTSKSQESSSSASDIVQTGRLATGKIVNTKSVKSPIEILLKKMRACGLNLSLKPDLRDNTEMEITRFRLDVNVKFNSNWSSKKYLVKLSLSKRGVFLLVVMDANDVEVDICNWSYQYQIQLLSAIRQPNVLQSIKNYAKSVPHPTKVLVEKFMDTYKWTCINLMDDLEKTAKLR